MLYQAFIKLLFVLNILILTACGESSEPDSSNQELSQVGDDTVLVNVNITPVEGLDLTAKNYITTIGGKSTVLSGGALSSEIEIDSTDLGTNSDTLVTTLATEYGEPILISYLSAADGSVELSVETSADTFVMRNPVFYGVEITDLHILSEKIREHEQYPALVKELIEQIVTSPCPMDFTCSMVAALIADDIANDIDFSDLVA